MPTLNEWYAVRFDNRMINLLVNPPNGTAWQAAIPWTRIIRVCFQAGDFLESDTVYLFTDDRPESYVIPTEADGGLDLWNEIISRKLFDAELAIEAAMATDELFCSPPHSPPVPAKPQPLTSPDQLPALDGETLILTWDQIDADSLILYGDTVIWREWTGWEVYDRFVEIALILKQKYGSRLKDLVPTSSSLYALYGDSTAANFHVAHARKSLGSER